MFRGRSVSGVVHPHVKCVVVERAHRTIYDKLYKYYSYKNTYRYADVLPKIG